MAIVVWVGLALERRQRRWLLLAWLLVLAIAFSRLALLRHDLLDLAGGLALGILALTLLEWLRRTLAPWRQLPSVELAGIWLLCALLAQRALPTDAVSLLAGVMAGIGAGSARRGFSTASAHTTTARTLLILLLNLGGIAAIRWGAERFALGQPMLLFALYFLGGWWIAGATPRFRPKERLVPHSVES
jgi:hypothetical protein